MIQDYDELFKRYIEIVEMADNTELDLNSHISNVACRLFVFFSLSMKVKIVELSGLVV